MIILTTIFYLLTTFSTPQTSVKSDTILAFCDFSRLTPGRFGDFAAKGFPEYHYVPRQFTDGWDIVNNRGPEEWKVIKNDGKYSLQYLGFNETEWTHDFTYPLLCYGDSLWRDYTLEVRLSPFKRDDLNGVVFRYQDGRHYYLFGLDKGDRVTLRYRDGEKAFHQDGWHELATGSFPTDPAKSYTLRVEASGTRIRCSIDNLEVFNVSDKRYPGGKVGLMANSPVAFHEVLVSATVKAKEEFLAIKAAREMEIDELRHDNPKPVLWKRINTKGFGAARALRLGDLDGDGRLDFLIVQNMPFFNSNYNEITCITALDQDGRMLWQSGSPNPDHAWVSYDVAVQIHDLDGDGKNEVVLAQGPWIRVLEGKTGKEKARYPVPSSAILPDEKSWLDACPGHGAQGGHPGDNRQSRSRRDVARLFRCLHSRRDASQPSAAVVAAPPPPDAKSADALRRRAREASPCLALDGRLRRRRQALRAAPREPELAQARPREVAFYPYVDGFVEAAAPQQTGTSDKGFVIESDHRLQARQQEKREGAGKS